MCSCSCSCLSSCSLSRGFVPFVGPIMVPPSRQQQPGVPRSNVFSSHAPHTLAPPVASPAPTRLLWRLCLLLYAPALICQAAQAHPSGCTLRASPVRTESVPPLESQILTFMLSFAMASLATPSRS